MHSFDVAVVVTAVTRPVVEEPRADVNGQPGDGGQVAQIDLSPGPVCLDGGVPLIAPLTRPSKLEAQLPQARVPLRGLGGAVVDVARPAKRLEPQRGGGEAQRRGGAAVGLAAVLQGEPRQRRQGSGGVLQVGVG